MSMDHAPVENGAVCHKESANGGHDVWSCASTDHTDSSSPDHLVIMVNGILGSADDWKFGAEQFVSMLPDKVFVHCSKRNVAKFTLDGIDVMGRRLAEEILEVIKRKPNLRKISFVAHSVGGLVARYAIGILYRPSNSNNPDTTPNEDSAKIPKGTIEGLEAMNFVTVATPHLGSRGNKQVPFLFGVPAFEKFASLVIHWIFRRTGKHLFLTDCDEGTPPLLKRMVEDNHEYRFMSALETFRRRAVYSNVEYDHIVGWRTACIRHINQLPKFGDPVNEKYPHIVHEEHCKPLDMQDCKPDLPEEGVSDKIEEELVTGLSRVSWEKIDVSFHDSKLKYAAHSVIQVKYHYIHSDGADVIQHIIDHFIV